MITPAIASIEAPSGLEIPEIHVDISPEQYHADCGRLGSNIVKYCLASGKRVDRVITAARGGLTPTEYVMKRLGMRAGQLITVNLQQYGLQDTQLTGDMVVDHLPDPDELRDLEVVYVDELNDRGGAAEFFENLCTAAEVRSFTIATVYQKPRTRRPSDVIVRGVPNHHWLNLPSDLHGEDPMAHLVVNH